MQGSCKQVAEAPSQRDETVKKLEESDEPGARVLARILRRAASEETEVVMWAQNWNAHSRST